MFFYKQKIALTAILILVGCSANNKKIESTDQATCNDTACIQKVCTSYTSETSSTNSKSTVCPVTGSCLVPNMSLTMQLSNGIPGENLVCGGASTKMVLDAVLANMTTKDSITGWTKQQYSQITANSTSYCSNITCQKILAIADKVIEPKKWVEEPRAIFASEVEKFFKERSTELGSEVNSFASSAYPTDIDKCKFVTGAQAISNKQAPGYEVLYKEYPLLEKSTSSYQDGALKMVALVGPANYGHYVTLEGFSVTDNDIMFKFLDPIYGIKWYGLMQVTLNQPFCITFDKQKNKCTNYYQITEMPAEFGTGPRTITLLVEKDGQMSDQAAVKVIAFVSGLMLPL